MAERLVIDYQFESGPPERFSERVSLSKANRQEPADSVNGWHYGGTLK